MENKLYELRFKREMECFQIVNRGKPWYDNLTQQQLDELLVWYREWLDITDTYRNKIESGSEVAFDDITPQKPTWLE